MGRSLRVHVGGGASVSYQVLPLWPSLCAGFFGHSGTRIHMLALCGASSRFAGYLGAPVSPLVPALFPPTAAEPVAPPVPPPWSWDEWWCASGPGWVFGSPVTLDCVWCDFRPEAGNSGAKGQVLSRHVWAEHQARRLAATLAPTRQCPVRAGMFANPGSCQRHLVSQHSVHDGAVRTVLRSLGADC